MDVKQTINVDGSVGSIFIRFTFLMMAAVLLSLTFVSLYRYLLTSPYMKLEKVVVEGVDDKLKVELIETCELHSGLSLLGLNLKQMRLEMKRHPWIRSVRLGRRFPHTLVIHAEKEVPLALVVMDRLYYLNDNGEIFKEVKNPEAVDYPVITGLLKRESLVLKQLAEASLIVNILNTEQGEWPLGALSEIHFNGNMGISLYFERIRAEIKVMQGDFERKLHGLRRLIQHLDRSNQLNMVATIDLNYVDGAAVSFRRS